MPKVDPSFYDKPHGPIGPDDPYLQWTDLDERDFEALEKLYFQKKAERQSKRRPFNDRLPEKHRENT